jgi:ABC-type multidrug transport system fused ATPase/permease subunit
MIRGLYKKYRRQIAFAFILVVLENIAYIAEPYVFGKAIDGLREARQIEEEVDSSVTDISIRQVADSVRAHVLDSIRTVDSLQRLDSLESEVIPPPNLHPFSDRAIANLQRTRAGSNAYYTFHLRGQPLVRYAVYQIPDLPAPDSTDEAVPLHADPDSVRRLVARRDSLRGRQIRKHSLVSRNKEAARDSIRKKLQAMPPVVQKPIGSHPSKSIGFYLPKEVGPFLPPLIPWVLLFIINSSLGAVRRLYDTRLYTKMFANLSSDVVARQLAQGEELSKVAARSSMAWHNIEFFQYNVPEFLEQLIAVGGAVIALAIFDWRLTVVGSALILMVGLGSKYYMRTVQTIQVALHDRYEDEYNIFSTRQPQAIRQYYTDIADLEIKLSKRSTISYGVIRVFLLMMFLFTLYISIDLDRFTIGSLYSIVAYVWSFVTATEYIPYLAEKWVALKDASRRIEDNTMFEVEGDEEEEE